MQNMEKRKNSIGAVKMCRFCLTQSETLESLYDRKRTSKSSVNLHLKILSCVSIEIYPSDKMPTFICEKCKFFMNIFYEYKQIVRQADETILQYIQHGLPMEITTWPSTLDKIYQNLNKVVSTVIESGATVQVTSHDNSDTDDEDANVYNIKIENTSEDTKTACVKVITSKDEKLEDMDDAKVEETGQIDIDQMNIEKSKDGCWPCDECDCAFPLRQLLELHKRKKHRIRTLECDQCHAKFFSKYNLTVHLLSHKEEMPFKCVACGKKFKRLILLKRHEKQVHSDLPQHECPNCPASFLSLEDLEEHQQRHIRVTPFDCGACGKKFHEKSSLQRHIDVVHNKAPTYCCAYCPERFVSMTKLAKHVRTHAGARSYPCKHCSKTFTKSHHYTRHLRLKHRESRRSSLVAGDAEQYRCEQCDDAFATQDELIYHSAIHATRDLTCPLCQEKFGDVDAVTAHIKSHVNGVEFMCDYCELVFVSKEKLNKHSLLVHDDEMQSEMYPDESSMDYQDDDDDDIKVKDEGDHMLIEIKKPDEFMISNSKEEKTEATNSEESESETTYTEMSTVDTLPAMKKSEAEMKQAPKQAPAEVKTVTEAKSEKPMPSAQQATILRKAEEIKKKVAPQTNSTAVVVKKKQPEAINSGGASDKSLRLLEKELQDLKQTNSRTEVNKTPVRTLETLRNKRPQLHTSTPKLRMTEERKFPITNKTPAIDKKKELEKRVVTKENKEPKETKESKNSNNSLREEKEKDTPKSAIKSNSNGDKSNTDDGVRRSTRPSKIRNYAKMIREQSQADLDEDETSDEDEDYTEDKAVETFLKLRKSVQSKGTPKSAATPSSAPRKRGRPRKDTPKEVPAKVKKGDDEQKDDESETKSENNSVHETNTVKDEVAAEVSSNASDEKNVCKTPEQKTPNELLVSPSGHTLKKVPIRALPPGVKPLPLPINARPMGTGELCEMQIGKKVVKVQKIVMTKAEVEAMAKKGLVEMKDGTMVLKQGIKFPTIDTPPKPAAPTEGEAEKEANKPTPTRCNLEDES